MPLMGPSLSKLRCRCPSASPLSPVQQLRRDWPPSEQALRREPSIRARSGRLHFAATRSCTGVVSGRSLPVGCKRRRLLEKRARGSGWRALQSDGSSIAELCAQLLADDVVTLAGLAGGRAAAESAAARDWRASASASSKRRARAWSRRRGSGGEAWGMDLGRRSRGRVVVAVDEAAAASGLHGNGVIVRRTQATREEVDASIQHPTSK